MKLPLLRGVDGCRRLLLTLLVMVSISLSVGCASTQQVEGSTGEGESAVKNVDPWEPFNRKVYAFNEVADRYFMKPIAKGYQWLMPEPVDQGISNFFSNLGEVGTIFNDLLQLKFKQGASDSARFIINSTFGVLGFFDVAARSGLPKHNEDFGQTLGFWGVEQGPYVVLPFLGPRNVRDSFGLAVDSFALPSYTDQVDHVPTRNQMFATDVTDTRADLLEQEKLISGDRYVFLRDAYLSRREFLVKDGAIEDDFGSEDFDSDFEDWDE